MSDGMEREACVVGAGPAGLMAAEVLARGGVRVTLYERMPTPGRKFLMAGRGGLNLTHAEPSDVFCTRYGAAAARLSPVLDRFSPAALRAWSAALGQETFVGSSGRVFPATWKASPLLRAWLVRLAALGVVLAPRHRWIGWTDDGALRFETPQGVVEARPAATVLALGGASWPALGGDGAWVPLLATAGLPVAPLRPANSGLLVAWSELFRMRFEGQPLKGVAFHAAGLVSRSEAVVTRTGLEGGGVYPLSAALGPGAATVFIDLKPDVTAAQTAARWTGRADKQSTATALRKALHLSPLAIALLRETTPDLAGLAPAELAALVHAVPLRTAGVAPLARAISSAGGLAFEALDDTLMLTTCPGTFAAGEMLDWTAPTGGYLLQAAFALGATAGAGALTWLQARAALTSG